MSKKKYKGDKQMSAVKVKPIQPTNISDYKIWQQICKEATKKPSKEALEKNEEALKLFKKLKG